MAAESETFAFSVSPPPSSTRIPSGATSLSRTGPRRHRRQLAKRPRSASGPIAR